MALVFELMDCNLYELYKHKKTLFNLDRIRSICHDLLEATAFIHQKGIFHRDIKPENILVKGDRDIKLADFGSCKSTRSPTQICTLLLPTLSISPPAGIVPRSVYSPTDTTQRKWTSGASAAFSLSSTLSTRCFQGRMSWTKPARSSPSWGVPLWP